MVGFLAESRIGPKKKVLKHGEYLIKAHASIREIVDVLSEGKAVQYKVTDPRGPHEPADRRAPEGGGRT